MADGDQPRHGTMARGEWPAWRFALKARARRWVMTIAVGAFAACGLPAAALASTGVPQLGGTGVLGQVAAVPHGMGLVVNQQPALSASAVAAVSKAATALPASVDLTPNAAPVGNQGQVSSCAAWSSDYGALGYWENAEGIAGGVLEPMYTYSQLVNGQNTGTSIDSNLQIAQQQGVDSQADYAQGNFDYTDLPTAAEKANAVHWKLTGYKVLAIQQSKSATVTQQSIETALAAGNPVVIGIPVYANFESLTSANHGLYSAVSGQMLGYHAITALGYNSTGLRIENSWTTGWGDSGFATLSWSFVNTYVVEAVSVGPLVTAAPAQTAPPTIAGTPQQGQQLTATSGAWTPVSSSFTYQWQRSTDGGKTWSAISGATATTYAVTSADVGASIRVQVTAAAFGQSTTANSTFVGPITTAAPANTVAPPISGTARQAQVLSSATGTWTSSVTSYAYQWQRLTDSAGTWQAIKGATAAKYTLAGADVAATVRVVVTAANKYGKTSANSTPTGPVLSAAPGNTALPAVNGTAARGAALSAANGTWTPAATSYAYQWQRSTDGGNTWSVISGATAGRYVPVAADETAMLRVVVTANNSYGHTIATSAAVGPIATSPPVNTVAPKVTGSAKSGSALTATAGTWTGAGNAYTYQWQRNTGSGYVSISGATTAKYVLTAADAGASVQVVVTATNPDAAVPQASNTIQVAASATH